MSASISLFVFSCHIVSEQHIFSNNNNDSDYVFIPLRLLSIVIYITCILI